MINLTPSQTKENARYGRLNLRIMHYVLGIGVTGILIFVTCLIGLNSIESKNQALQEQLASTGTSLAAYTETIESAEELSRTIQTIRSLLSREVTFSTLITSIAALVPAGATLDSISLSNEQNTLQLSATLENQALGAVFQKNLVESDLFVVADIVSITESSGSSFNGTFTVVFAPEAAPGGG